MYIFSWENVFASRKKISKTVIFPYGRREMSVILQPGSTPFRDSWNWLGQGKRLWGNIWIVPWGEHQWVAWCVPFLTRSPRHNCVNGYSWQREATTFCPQILQMENSWGENKPSSLVAQLIKNPLANAGDLRDVGSIPGSGRSPGEGNGNALQYSCLENPMEGGAW